VVGCCSLAHLAAPSTPTPPAHIALQNRQNCQTPNFCAGPKWGWAGRGQRRWLGAQVKNPVMLCCLWASWHGASPIRTVTDPALPLPPPHGLSANHPVPRQSNARTCFSLWFTDRGRGIPRGPWRSGNGWVRSPSCRGPGAPVVLRRHCCHTEGVPHDPPRSSLLRRGPGPECNVRVLRVNSA